jgi:predicted outer membrane repeat protein
VDGTQTTVTLSGLTISQGVGVAGTVYDGDGGGILNFATLTVSACDLLGNTAATDGGGIYNAGTLTVSGSMLLSNIATDGGGIYNAQGATLKVNSGSLIGDYNNGDNGNEAFKDGGGIYNAGTAKVNNSTLDYNWTDGVTYGGGAIYNAGTMTVNGCNLTDDGFDPLPNGGNGTGAIYNVQGAALTVEYSDFVGNYPYSIDGSYTNGGGNTFS